MKKNYIVTVESIYREEFEVFAENEDMALSAVLKSFEQSDHATEEPEDFYARRFYIRQANQSESENREVCSVCTLSDEEAEEAAAELRTTSNEDCENCPFDKICKNEDHEIDDLDDEEDDDPTELILAYMDIIFDKLENIIDCLEKVYETPPKK